MCELTMFTMLFIDKPATLIAKDSSKVKFTGFMGLYDLGYAKKEAKGKVELHFVYNSEHSLFAGTYKYLSNQAKPSAVGKVVEVTFFYCPS